MTQLRNTERKLKIWIIYQGEEGERCATLLHKKAEEMKAADYIVILRELHAEIQPPVCNAANMPGWCQPMKVLSPGNYSKRDITSIERGELDAAMEQLREKLATADKQSIGNVDCNSEELEVLLILSGLELTQCNIPEESNVDLPEWRNSIKKYAMENEKFKPFIQQLLRPVSFDADFPET